MRGIGLVALATGKTSDIIQIAVLGALTLYVLAAASVIRLRRREPDLPRPYHAPLYPVTPIVALVLSLVCIVAMVVKYPTLAAVYAAILVGAWLAFIAFVPAERRTLSL